MEFFMSMIPPTVTHQEKKVSVINGHPVFYEPSELKAARRKLTDHEIDWASVPVDTPVIIKGFNFNRRYFSRILPDGRISIFSHGRTSWSAQGMALEVPCSKSDVVLAREADKLKYRKQVK